MVAFLLVALILFVFIGLWVVPAIAVALIFAMPFLVVGWAFMKSVRVTIVREDRPPEGWFNDEDD